ncbi:hypothetical protein O7627_36755 [Solwaraspora sp. WMMD1047]|uniref:hypothetical protein n=1 Tax=Solwaraspora sp. WMMD1047 TaxID=3016102 RepID=UPI002415B73A|nr:hypothetical protein [Solwaraspora sp. WMMD1047]MDG4834821.1 hypothetical protein [Solwaraspora sp. WMMD1047]
MSKAAVRRALPHAMLIVNHLHIVQLAGRAIAEVAAKRSPPGVRRRAALLPATPNGNYASG